MKRFRWWIVVGCGIAAIAFGYLSGVAETKNSIGWIVGVAVIFAVVGAVPLVVDWWIGRRRHSADQDDHLPD